MQFACTGSEHSSSWRDSNPIERRRFLRRTKTVLALRSIPIKGSKTVSTERTFNWDIQLGRDRPFSGRLSF